MSNNTDHELKVADRIDGVLHPAENPLVTGHDDALDHLSQQYRSGRIHHAWLINGPRGIGKATLAFRFAGHVLRNPQPDMAPQEWSYAVDGDTIESRIAGGGHPNLLHLARPWDFQNKKFKTQLTVDEIRLTVPFFGTSRGESGWRIAIVDSMDEMNRSASNSLLKILEEPPDNTLFFIISHSRGSVSPTIWSRCQTLSLKPLSDADLLEVLERLGVLSEVDESNHALLTKLSGGSVRQAIVLARNDGLELHQKFSEACRDLAKPDWPDIHALADSVSLRGREDRYRLLLSMAGEYLETNATKVGEGATDISKLARWAEVWEKTRHSADLAERYNLDRKQVILNLFQSMGEVVQQQ